MGFLGVVMAFALSGCTPSGSYDNGYGAGACAGTLTTEWEDAGDWRNGVAAVYTCDELGRQDTVTHETWSADDQAFAPARGDRFGQFTYDEEDRLSLIESQSFDGGDYSVADVRDAYTYDDDGLSTVVSSVFDPSSDNWVVQTTREYDYVDGVLVEVRLSSTLDGVSSLVRLESFVYDDQGRTIERTTRTPDGAGETHTYVAWRDDGFMSHTSSFWYTEESDGQPLDRTSWDWEAL